MIDKNFSMIFLEILGEGAFGKVYKCFDESKWKFYALKIEYIEREELQQKAIEMQILANLT